MLICTTWRAVKLIGVFRKIVLLIAIPSILIYSLGGWFMHTQWGEKSPNSDERLFLFIWWSMGYIPITFTITCIVLLTFFLFHRQFMRRKEMNA